MWVPLRHQFALGWSDFLGFILARFVELGQGAFGETAALGDCPFVVDLEEDCARRGRSTDFSLPKMPTSARRLISTLTCSRGCVDHLAGDLNYADWQHEDLSLTSEE
jgi:hypothetical protein